MDLFAEDCHEQKRCKSLFLQIFQAMIDGIWRPILDFTDRTSWVQGVQAKLGIFLSMYSMDGHPVGLSLYSQKLMLSYYFLFADGATALLSARFVLACFAATAK